MKHVRKRLTYANVMVTILAFIVLGGGTAFALAQNSIGTRELKPNSVNRAILARNSVYPGKINLEAVKAGRIAKNAIASDRLRNNIVSTSKILDEAVTSGKLANTAVTNPKMASNSVSKEKIAINSVDNEKISNNSVNQEKLQPGSVGAAQFKGLITRTNSVAIGAGASSAVSVACAPGEQIISAGTHWSNFENDLETNYIRISGNTAIGRGNNDTGAQKTFFVDAYCLST